MLAINRFIFCKNFSCCMWTMPLSSKAWAFCKFIKIAFQRYPTKLYEFVLHVIITWFKHNVIYKSVHFLQKLQLMQGNDAFIFESLNFIRKVLLSMIRVRLESAILIFNLVAGNGGQHIESILSWLLLVKSVLWCQYLQ